MKLNYQVFGKEYQGPLEGLLEVARGNEVPLSQVNLAKLVDDFVNHLANREDWRVSEASSLLLVFSELLRIKSRELLPREETEESEPEPEPEADEERKQFFQEVGETLKEKARERARLYEPSPDLPEFIREGETVYKEVTLFELIKAFQQIVVTRKQGRRQPEFEFSDDYDTDTQMKIIKERIPSGEAVGFEEMIDSRPEREEVVVTFVALLQLVKMDELRIVKKVETDQIFVIAREQKGN